MLRGFAGANKNHRDVRAISLPQDFVLIDVHLAQRGAEFAEQRLDQRFRFLAEVATGTRVQRNCARSAAASRLSSGLPFMICIRTETAKQRFK